VVALHQPSDGGDVPGSLPVETQHHVPIAEELQRRLDPEDLAAGDPVEVGEQKVPERHPAVAIPDPVVVSRHKLTVTQAANVDFDTRCADLECAFDRTQGVLAPFGTVGSSVGEDDRLGTGEAQWQERLGIDARPGG